MKCHLGGKGFKDHMIKWYWTGLDYGYYPIIGLFNSQELFSINSCYLYYIYIFIYITLFNHPIQIDSIINYSIVGIPTPLKNHGLRQLGSDEIPEIPNHQPDPTSKLNPIPLVPKIRCSFSTHRFFPCEASIHPSVASAFQSQMRPVLARQEFTSRSQNSPRKSTDISFAKIEIQHKENLEILPISPAKMVS